MRSTSPQKRRKWKPNDGQNGLIGRKCSSPQSHTIKTSSSGTCFPCRKYFNDTVPEEIVRSTLPSELAEEYLSFVQQCEARKKKDESSNAHKANPEKKPCQVQQSNDRNEFTAEHKENLPIAEEVRKSVTVKKGRRKQGRRRKSTIKNILKCLLCSEEFPTKQKKQEHYNDHLGSRGYECTFCAKAFDKMPSLVSHVSRIHLIDKNLACKICGKKFRREWLLRSHSLTHTSGRKFSCPTCKMGFTHKRHLFEHISGHVGFNPYKCEECGKRFQRSSYLSLHRKVHLSVRPFKCKVCNIQCSSYSAIEIHALMHEKNGGFECVDCNIRIPATMKSTHLISHSRKKSFQCNLCPARFHARSTLRDHIKAHSHIKEFKCDVCNKILLNLGECSNHICPKWQGSFSVESCPTCNLYIKKDCLKEHSAKCHENPSSANSNVDCDVNEDELWDESGESVLAVTNGYNRVPVDCLNSSGDEYDSSSMGDESHESDIDDVSEVDNYNLNSLELDFVCESDRLDLDGGLMHQIKQIQNEVEEDDDSDTCDS